MKLQTLLLATLAGIVTSIPPTTSGEQFRVRPKPVPFGAPSASVSVLSSADGKNTMTQPETSPRHYAAILIEGFPWQVTDSGLVFGNQFDQNGGLQWFRASSLGLDGSMRQQISGDQGHLHMYEMNANGDVVGSFFESYELEGAYPVLWGAGQNTATPLPVPTAVSQVWHFKQIRRTFKPTVPYPMSLADYEIENKLEIDYTKLNERRGGYATCIDDDGTIYGVADNAYITVQYYTHRMGNNIVSDVGELSYFIDMSSAVFQRNGISGKAGAWQTLGQVVAIGPGPYPFGTDLPRYFPMHAVETIRTTDTPTGVDTLSVYGLYNALQYFVFKARAGYTATNQLSYKNINEPDGELLSIGGVGIAPDVSVKAINREGTALLQSGSGNHLLPWQSSAPPRRVSTIGIGVAMNERKVTSIDENQIQTTRTSPQIVGAHASNDQLSTGVLLEEDLSTEAYEAYDLNTLASMPSGWRITGANDINNSGIIVGAAKNASTGQTKGVVLLPVEIDSRDRAVEGFIPNIDPTKPMKLGFSSGSKSYGTYEIPQSGSSNDIHVYDSVDDIFSDTEAEQYRTGSLPAKAWQQQVVLVREGNGVRFYTVADNLGEFKVTLYSGTQQIGEVTHQLTEDKDFGRVIATANGFIKGDEPPRITGWINLSVDNSTEYPTTPTLTAAQLGNLLASGPPSVASTYSSGSTATNALSAGWQTDSYQFVGFVLAVRRAASAEQWAAFVTQLQQIGYDPTPIVNNATPNTAGAPNAAAAAAALGVYSNPAPGASRNELQMPTEITNRGLVAKALMWIIKKTVLTQAAIGEGVIFGMWDGIKGDVEGVVDLLTLQPLRDFIQFVKDPYRAAGELHKIFRYLKENGWSGVKNIATAMLQEFMGPQQARLECLLGSPDVQDPAYLNAYLAGYGVGFIGEQVVVAVFTAGVGKVGWIARAFEMGNGAATKLLQLAGNVGAKVHKASKGFFADLARVGRSADEVRATRRSASLCRSQIGCLAAGTLVLMADGSYQPIQDIRHGASVLADDPYDNEPPKPALVRAQMETHNTTLLEIRYGDADTITCTVEHPFYVANRGWVMATDVRLGDHFVTPDARTLTVSSITERAGQFTTYNLDVDGPDSFFITANRSASPILVHNLQGEEGMYGYLPGSGQIGTSQAFTPTGVPRFNPDGSPLMLQNPQHHFYYDAGIKSVFTDAPLVFTHPAQTLPVSTVFPSIELTHEQHVTAHIFGDNWLANNGYHRALQMTKDDWLQLYADGKWNELAEEMVRGANTKGANITPAKVAKLKNACAGRLTQFNRRKSCAGL